MSIWSKCKKVALGWKIQREHSCVLESISKHAPAEPTILFDNPQIGQDNNISHAQVILKRDLLGGAPTSASHDGSSGGPR